MGYIKKNSGTITSESPVEDIFRLTPYQKRALKKLGLFTAANLMFHFPVRYQSLATPRAVGDLKENEHVSIYGRIKHISAERTFRGHKPVARAVVEDGSGAVNAIWFYQPYIANMFAEGAMIRLAGKIHFMRGNATMVNPEIEPAREAEIGAARPLALDGGVKNFKNAQFPVYPESQGITSRWFYYAFQKLFKFDLHSIIPDPIPVEILKKYHLPSLKTALLWIHAPRSENDSVAARKRFSFEEVFSIQLARIRDRKILEKSPAFKIEAARSELEDFVSRLPFPLTRAQERCVSTVLGDFCKGSPMSRLLEGDVGSGKTAVAAITAYAAVNSPSPRNKFATLQVAYMAPTEILARQHFDSFIKYFSHCSIQIGLITSSFCKKFPSKTARNSATSISRSQLLRFVESGEIQFLVGTHSLIQKDVRFRDLAYIVIDEQHRFGTNQRKALVKKESTMPHLLSMTATPIPRTLALTIYGDLDLSLLDEQPPGRKPVITEAVSFGGRETAYAKVSEELFLGRQTYVICPRIEEPDPEKALALQAKSVTEEARRLKEEVFPEYEIGVLHGKMRPKERDSVMGKFVSGSINILVATSVIEVGVNVPNATVIIIEGAERFGLAQLHQLRGRVLRSEKQAYCFAFADRRGRSVSARLRAFSSAKNGFELAEMDLKLRGTGELSGGRQWGISDVGMEALQNIKMVEAAREEARKILDNNPELNEYPLLKALVEKKGAGVHFE